MFLILPVFFLATESWVFEEKYGICWFFCRLIWTHLPKIERGRLLRIPFIIVYFHKRRFFPSFFRFFLLKRLYNRCGRPPHCASARISDAFFRFPEPWNIDTYYESIAFFASVTCFVCCVLIPFFFIILEISTDGGSLIWWNEKAIPLAFGNQRIIVFVPAVDYHIDINCKICL